MGLETVGFINVGETGQARDGARAQGVSRQRLTQLVCGQVGSDVTLEEEVSAGGPRASPPHQ